MQILQGKSLYGHKTLAGIWTSKRKPLAQLIMMISVLLSPIIKRQVCRNLAQYLNFEINFFVFPVGLLHVGGNSVLRVGHC